jgi:hypothetical protein
MDLDTGELSNNGDKSTLGTSHSRFVALLGQTGRARAEEAAVGLEQTGGFRSD